MSTSRTILNLQDANARHAEEMALAWQCTCRRWNNINVDQCECGIARYKVMTAADWTHIYEQTCDAIIERAIARCEAIDREHGVTHDYSVLRRTPHFSIQCAHCDAHLEYTVSEGQDEAIELDNARHAAKWKQTLDGLSCPTCAAFVVYQAVL